MAAKVDVSIPDGKISLDMNGQTDSKRSDGKYMTVLEHSGISGEDNRGADADESDSFDKISRVKGKDGEFGIRMKWEKLVINKLSSSVDILILLRPGW